MSSKPFTVKELNEAIRWESDYLDVVEENMVDQSRWETRYEVIIKDTRDNKYYRGYFKRGSTEDIESSLFGEDEEEILELSEVEKVPVTTLKWVPVKNK